MGEKVDHVSGMDPLERRLAEEHLKCINPDDAKYWKTTRKVSPYLSAAAEWRGCAFVQKVLLETRVEFGQAKPEHLAEVTAALERISPLNMALLEDNVTHHDQLAVLEELGRFVSPETKALLHPGTTSYDIVDTVRAYLFKNCWNEAMLPKIKETIGKLCDLAEKYIDSLQVGRTHLQDTSPVTFGIWVAGYARRLAECAQECDNAYAGLRGKISGIVGTGASIEAVIGKGKALEFERKALEKLGLQPDPTATQITQKERMVRVATNVALLMGVTANFANDIRMLYSSAIGEVTSLKSAELLGGSSADAGKNNPVNYENIAGKCVVVQSGLPIAYAQLDTNFMRDLRNSVQARYEPQLMMTRTYESLCRLSRSLDELFVKTDVLARNLIPVRQRPTEAMTAITRAHGYVHPELGVGHDAVKEFAKRAQKSGKILLEEALNDAHFNAAFTSWPEEHQEIIMGKLELYLGPAKDKARDNIRYARAILTRNA